MGWEQRNADFCNAQTDAQMAYIEAEREVDQLQAENAKLRELCKDIYDETVSGCYGCLSLEHVKHPSKCDNGICEYKRIVDRIRELGIEVDG